MNGFVFGPNASATFYNHGSVDVPSAVKVLADWFEMVDPNEQMSWLELAGAMFAPECRGPLANPEFVSKLPGSQTTRCEVSSIKVTAT